MALYRVKILGIPKLELRLLELASDLDLKKTYGELSRKAQRFAQGFAPVVTGRLRSSIKASHSKGYAAVYSRLVYAPVINYGWEQHHIQANRFMQRASQAVEPFVRPTLERAIFNLIARKGLS